MKNKEKYFDFIVKVFAYKNIGEDIATCEFRREHVLKQKMCNSIPCEECNKRTYEWLEAEYQEHIKLTDDEIVILKNIPKNYKWIARTIGILVIFENAPFKIPYNNEFAWDYKKGSSDNIRLFSHLFKFIKNEDEEPYNIDELLKQNGVER